MARSTMAAESAKTRSCSGYIWILQLIFSSSIPNESHLVEGQSPSLILK